VAREIYEPVVLGLKANRVGGGRFAALEAELLKE